MLKLKFIPMAVLALVWSMPGITIAQPNLHGTLTGTLGPGTYIVDGDCQVNYGTTVTVEPGTDFLFSGHYTWNIYGTLLAEGAEDNFINFRRQFPNDTCKWGGIRFDSSGSDSSILDYCVIDHAKNYYYGGGIYATSAGPTIKHTRITNCYASYGGGVYATNNSSIVLDECVVMNCTAGDGGGIYLNYSDSSQILNSLIIRNTSTRD